MVNSLNPTVCVTYSHDFLRRYILVKRDTLDRDFLAGIRSLLNFTETTSRRNIFGIFDFALDQQLRGQYPPVCAQTLDLMSQVIPQSVRNLFF